MKTLKTELSRAQLREIERNKNVFLCKREIESERIGRKRCRKWGGTERHGSESRSTGQDRKIGREEKILPRKKARRTGLLPGKNADTAKRKRHAGKTRWKGKDLIERLSEKGMEIFLYWIACRKSRGDAVSSRDVNVSSFMWMKTFRFLLSLRKKIHFVSFRREK